MRLISAYTCLPRRTLGEETRKVDEALAHSGPCRKILPDPKNDYLWDNAATSEVSQRFTSLEIMYDPITFQHIESLGIAEGWRCLEVGGGGGSVSRWLSEKVGSIGRVFVTDINPQFLTGMTWTIGNVDVLKNDITIDSGIPKNAFDLAHARLVLIHLSQREKALANMVSAVRPGGWVVIEDFDMMVSEILADYHPRLGVPPTMSTGLYSKVIQARTRVLEEHGADLHYARKLYAMLRSNGLAYVGMSTGGVSTWSGGSACARLHIANSLQSRDEMIATGLLSEKEFDDSIKMMNDPEWVVFSHMMVSAWERKPL
jgi:ubiquinone/menaquinone biosynthesis C-methylase UbiE